MNGSKLKALLITICCFVVALCSEIKSMEAASEIQETTSNKAKNANSEGCLDSLKTEMSSDLSNARFLLNQDENKASETSWVSYMASPVKAVIHGTYNIVDFAVKHPTQTIITTLLIAAQFIVVAADCQCYCSIVQNIGSIYVMSKQNVITNVGKATSLTECSKVCKSMHGVMNSCN